MPSVKHHQVAIIGGGAAGITVAARLKRASSALDIVLIEPSDRHYYQPLWTLVGAGVVKRRAPSGRRKTISPGG